MKAVVLCVLLLALTVARSAQAEEEVLDASLHEKVLGVPGDPTRPVLLQVTTFTPEGPGPFPLAILNHGKEMGKRPEEELRYRSAFIARYFLSRGYAVALPMMRGFADSGGFFDPHGCDVEADGLAQASDIAAVIDYMARQPNIDASRIIVSGQSMGGWNTLAFATLGYPGVKGVLNFSGGIRQPKCLNWESHLIKGAGEYGSRTRIPSLWFYGDNDGMFAPSIWHPMYDNYVKHGGQATLVAYGTFISDAHNMLGSLEGLSIWMPKVDAFLVSLGLPGKLIEPRYLPAPFPPPSHFAALDDVNAVPYLNDKGRQDYRKFLTKPLPRVFIIMPSGVSADFDGGYDPLTRGLEACRKISRDAQVYAVDNQVVWNPSALITAGSLQSENPSAKSDADVPVATKDSAEASKWRALADQGNAAAQAHIGYLYQAGLGVPQDYSQALIWYQKAAAQADAGAENNLGYLYLKGLGINRDYAQALIWFHKAADQGLANAQNEMGNLYANGWGVPRDYAQALIWFKKAAGRGFDSAQYSMGYMYQHGCGVTENDGQAVFWYQKAAAQGFSPAVKALAKMKPDSPASLNPNPAMP